jgi:hypothetical protein
MGVPEDPRPSESGAPPAAAPEASASGAERSRESSPHDRHRTLVGVGPLAGEGGERPSDAPRSDTPRTSRPSYERHATLLGVGPAEAPPLTRDSQAPAEEDSTQEDPLPASGRRRGLAVALIAGAAVLAVAGGLLSLAFLGGDPAVPGDGATLESGPAATPAPDDAARSTETPASVFAPLATPSASASSPPAADDAAVALRAPASGAPSVACPIPPAAASGSLTPPESKPIERAVPATVPTRSAHGSASELPPRSTALPAVRDYGI